MVKTMEQLRAEQKRNKTTAKGGVSLSLYECRLLYEGWRGTPLPGGLVYADAAEMVLKAIGEDRFEERLESYRGIIADYQAEGLELPGSDDIGGLECNWCGERDCPERCKPMGCWVDPLI